MFFFFFSSRRRHTRWTGDWSSDVCSSDLIGHVRMATESDVDISGAHPYWAYPFSDVAVVHNGQLTNYFQDRKSTRLNSSHPSISYAVFCLKKKKTNQNNNTTKTHNKSTHN